ncbi:Fumarylacetoacetate hydrolase domain-containing protein [Lachnellula suecica]|uniref:Fumarylacetoacetate hydrolase domain-containing protein n=1 Tax=Lachnellula suecica TaxID=602035 RepID=A0A8T9CG66_9HELO|nr:Fumarylacetoacetate hydrolase domain-containing protein [Lachnellula suecica]
MVNFNYLVRFEDQEGHIHYGEASPQDAQSDLVGRSLKVYKGGALWDDNFLLSETVATVSRVLSPIASTPIIHGVGLNYKAHAEEGNLKLPPFPILFVKYPDTLAGPFEDIPIDKEAWQLDYEGELAVVIGKKCKSLSPSENPLDYILGYTIGNDVSSRYWQDKTRSSGQHGYAKSFDKFSPLGPVLVSTQAIPDPSKLKIITHVNGELRQESGTDSMIFDVASIIRHLSRGITLQPGTVILTGTPDGVAAFRTPSPWLQNGDVVEIEITGIGKIRNKMVFEDENYAPASPMRAPGF